MKIEILGMECKKCKMLYENAQESIKELRIEAEIVKVEDMKKIMDYNVVMTPALVVDGEVKIAGRVPDITEIINLLI